MTTPVYSAPKNGTTSNLDATQSAAHVNQLLGAHAGTLLYDGTPVVISSGGTQFQFTNQRDTEDHAQPFTMSGTTIGRVLVPLNPVGNGADVLVSLWPDNGSGLPNTVGDPIVATMLPAAYINQVAATTGLASGGPLATVQDNILYCSGSVGTFPWAGPAGDANGLPSNSAFTFNGNYCLFAGGFTNVAFAGVSTAYYASHNTLNQPILQPSLPQGSYYGAMCVTADNNSVVYAGGNSGSTVLSAVWVGGWDQSTGKIGAWSQGNALPAGRENGGLASAITSSGTVVVYYLGGSDATPTAHNDVWFTTISNGQTQPWVATSPLPISVAVMGVAAINGWLVVAGGNTNGTVQSTTFFSKIQPDGTLSPWISGPTLPVPAAAYSSGWDCAFTDSSIVMFTGGTTGGGATNAIQVLMVDPVTGPGTQWVSSLFSTAAVYQAGAFDQGNGVWDLVSPNIFSSVFRVTTLTPAPLISVPMPATGLTNGATYHLLVQQFSPSNAEDSVQIGFLDDYPLPQTALIRRPRYSNTWISEPTGFSIPIFVYDQSQSTSNSLVRHVWSEPVHGVGQSWATMIYNEENLLAGALLTTMKPNNALNVNPTFTSGISPWVAINATITQSNAQTHGGFPFSGLLTPTGGNSLAYATSEQFPMRQTEYGSAQYAYVNGYLYSPTGWSGVSLSVNWFDSSGAYLSTSSNTVSLSAATWTFVSNYFQVPATAAFAAIVPTESGTPGATNTLYLSNVQLQLSYESVGALPGAFSVTYNGSLPTGVTQLV